MNQRLIDLLNEKVALYNQPDFIKDDPISIPHLFSTKQDIEIAGFFAAILAWGNRTSIINSCKRLFGYMNNQPYQYILNFNDGDASKIQPLLGFVHRTFNATDLLYLLHFMHYHYAIAGNASLETAFTKDYHADDVNIENALNGFRAYVFSPSIHESIPQRTQKHIASPNKKSACKRLNMYLRWMVRKDNNGVDFGLWHALKPHQLICPLDVHVARVAKQLHLLERTQTDWQAAVELTEFLKELDAYDPVKYDFALFGLGVVEGY